MTVLEASGILQLQPNGVIRVLNLPSLRAEMLYVFHVGDSVAGWFFFYRMGFLAPCPTLLLSHPGFVSAMSEVKD